MLSKNSLIVVLLGFVWLSPINAQWYDQYQDLTSIYDRVDQYSIDYPSLVSTSVIGQSVEGRDIRAFKVAGTGGNRAVKPAVLLTSMSHAREWITPMANMYAAEQLLSSYGSDPQVTALLDHVDVMFVPIVNPDGYEYSWASPSTRLWRKNRRLNADGTYGVDLNRNFDFAFGGPGSDSFPASNTYRGPSAFSEPETRALRDYFHANPNIVSYVDLHSYSQLILGPFGHSATAVAPDQAVLDKVGKEMENAILSTNFQLYKYQRASDLYLASGISSDWSYGTQSAYSYTYELRPNTRFPGFELPADQIVATSVETFAGIQALFDFTTELTNGDFNYDGSHDCVDLDLLTMEFVSNFGSVEFQNKFEFDISGDGGISQSDIAAWLSTNGYGLADANLDGLVNDADRLIWESNQGMATHSFCQGDFNTDGLVNDLDFSIWQAAVPEPGGLWLILLGLVGLLRRRK